MDRGCWSCVAIIEGPETPRVSIYGPLIDRTHQGWKLHVATLGIVLAIVVHVVARLFIRGITAGELAFYSGASAVIAAVSLCVFFASVRCPACRANWVWRAIRQRPGRWLEWLQEQQACPVCGSSGAMPPDNR